MSIETEDKVAFAWSETKWYAVCPHCHARNEIDAGDCDSGAACDAVCEVCRKPFGFRSGT
jgi:hypothetical protein